jgi:hypothetical protein
LGIFRADAFDHAAAEITLDAFAGGRRDGAEFLGAQLEAVFLVVDPEAFGGEPFAGGDGGERADDGDEVAAAFGFDPENGEAAFFIEESDAFDQAANRFDCFRSFVDALFDRAHHEVVKQDWQAGIGHRADAGASRSGRCGVSEANCGRRGFVTFLPDLSLDFPFLLAGFGHLQFQMRPICSAAN